MSNKYYGIVGFAEPSETSPGVYEEQIRERYYYGDVLKNYKRNDSTGKVNPDLKVSNRISIVTDPYASDHFFNIRYVEWMGAKWNVSDVDVQYPRLILSIDSVYNDTTGPAID